VRQGSRREEAAKLDLHELLLRHFTNPTHLTTADFVIRLPFDANIA
jgi:hypothetical protein